MLTNENILKHNDISININIVVYEHRVAKWINLFFWLKSINQYIEVKLPKKIMLNTDVVVYAPIVALTLLESYPENLFNRYNPSNIRLTVLHNPNNEIKKFK